MSRSVNWYIAGNVFISLLYILPTATECDLPGYIDNGISYITRSHDGVVTAHYACFNSYNIIGSLERTCLYNGLWTGTEPYCQQTGGEALY